MWRMLSFIYIKGKKNRRNFGEVIIYNVVFNPFSSRFGLPLHNTPFPGLLMKSSGGLFYDQISFLVSTACVLHLFYKLLIKQLILGAGKQNHIYTNMQPLNQ